MKKQILMFIGLLSLAPALWAHGGGAEHHGFMATLWHVVSQPDHLLGIAGGSIIVLGVIAGLVKTKRRAQQTKRMSPSLY